MLHITRIIYPKYCDLSLLEIGGFFIPKIIKNPIKLGKEADNVQTAQVSLTKKLVEVMRECAYVQKDAQNQHDKYTYASASAVLEKINKSLVKHGIATVTRPKIINAWERVTVKGNTLYFKEVEVEITLIDTDTGEEKVIHGIGCGMDTGDKAVMKAQTAAVKYAWLMSLQIATGDDPEADENTDLSTEEPGIPCYRVDNIVPSPKGDWAKVELTDVISGELLKDVIVRQSFSVFRAQNIQVGNRIICDFGEVSTKSGKIYKEILNPRRVA